MRKRCKSREEKNLLPFHIIKAASEGDVLAINTDARKLIRKVSM